ncbi:MAG: hypothetical protein J0H18_03210 [Rhizobiales bacterium]|nr:hypothetical protein [Hyphomicrobiales bacterium]OJY06667.1 MAG: hypothetical protein BGP07_16615 [Rhizobiales bacterium 63-22]
MTAFGHPGSITPKSFIPDMPLPMVLEGLALLREMGCTARELVEASGMTLRGIEELSIRPVRPYAPKDVAFHNYGWPE